MNFEKMNRMMEHLWIAIALASAVWAGFECYRSGWEVGSQWFMVTGIAAAMFMFRRFVRKRFEAEKRRQEQEENRK